MERAYNTNKLKGRIVEMFDTQLAFAEAIKCRPEIVSLTLAGKREMAQSEIEDWADALRIEPTQYYVYFFAHNDVK